MIERYSEEAPGFIEIVSEAAYQLENDPEWVAEKAIEKVWSVAGNEFVTLQAFAVVIKYAQEEINKLMEDMPAQEDWYEFDELDERTAGND